MHLVKPKQKRMNAYIKFCKSSFNNFNICAKEQVAVDHDQIRRTIPKRSPKGRVRND